VRDGYPLPFEFITQLYRVTELKLKVLEIGFRDLVHGCAFGDHVVGGDLKHGEEDLAPNSGIRVTHLIEEYVAPHVFIRFFFEQLIHQQHLGKSRGCLSEW